MSTALTAVSLAVHAVRSIPRGEARLAEARRVAGMLDDLDPSIGEETRRNLWVNLGRTVAGGGWFMGQTVTSEEVRAAFLDLFAADPPRRRRGRPPRPGRERVETMLYPAEVAQVEALIGTAGNSRSDVIAALVRSALATVKE